MEVEDVVDCGDDDGAGPDDAVDMAVDATINQESTAEDEALPKAKAKANEMSVSPRRPFTSKEKVKTRKLVCRRLLAKLVCRPLLVRARTPSLCHPAQGGRTREPRRQSRRG